MSTHTQTWTKKNVNLYSCYGHMAFQPITPNYTVNLHLLDLKLIRKIGNEIKLPDWDLRSKRWVLQNIFNVQIVDVLQGFP